MPTLNIKDPEVYRLAKELAERRHTSMTAVVRAALEREQEVDRPRRKATVEEIMEIGRRTKAAMDAAGEQFLDPDQLYDYLYNDEAGGQ